LVQISELKPGDSIAASPFTIETNKIKDYIKAVEESSGYFAQNSLGGVAPPIVCVSLAIAAVLKDVEFPDGTIHLSQEIRLNKPVMVGQTLHCHGSLMQNQVRKHLRIMTIRLEVDDELGEEVLEGKTSFILAE
jgi:acyl dehydratase